MTELERFAAPGGNIITLRTDGTRWEVVNSTGDGETVWTESSVTGHHPFTEEEARAEFDRWCV